MSLCNIYFSQNSVKTWLHLSGSSTYIITTNMGDLSKSLCNGMLVVIVLGLLHSCCQTLHIYLSTSSNITNLSGVRVVTGLV